MSIAFLDTSALLKLYLAEKGSAWLKKFIENRQIVVSELTLFESTTALRRRLLEGVYTRNQVTAILDQILLERFNYDVISLGGELQLKQVVSLVSNLAGSLRLRALDALQLVAATIALEDAILQNPPVSLTFLSSDVKLLEVARVRGFSVENPEDHT